MRITRFTILLTIFVVVLGSEYGFAEPAKYLFGKQLIAQIDLLNLMVPTLVVVRMV